MCSLSSSSRKLLLIYPTREQIVFGSLIIGFKERETLLVAATRTSEATDDSSAAATACYNVSYLHSIRQTDSPFSSARQWQQQRVYPPPTVVALIINLTKRYYYLSRVIGTSVRVDCDSDR